LELNQKGTTVAFQDWPDNQGNYRNDIRIPFSLGNIYLSIILN